MSEERYLTQKEFAKRLGVAVTTIYRWERAGLLSPHHITPGGRKYYSETQVRDLLNEKN